MGIRILLVVLLALAFSSQGSSQSFDSDDRGYSIELVSASPTPGSTVEVGQTLEFKIAVSYRLTVADSGIVVLVVQDEKNKNLLGGRSAKIQPVTRGTGTATLTDTLVVPAGSNEIRLFIPLVPTGMSRTEGEVVLHYWVRNAHDKSHP